MLLTVSPVAINRSVAASFSLAGIGFLVSIRQQSLNFIRNVHVRRFLNLFIICLFYQTILPNMSYFTTIALFTMDESFCLCIIICQYRLI